LPLNAELMVGCLGNELAITGRETSLRTWIRPGMTRKSAEAAEGSEKTVNVTVARRHPPGYRKRNQRMSGLAAVA